MHHIESTDQLSFRLWC